MLEYGELTNEDRCDSCSQPARAVVLVNIESSALYFCGHHFRKHKKALDDQEIYYSVPDWVADLSMPQPSAPLAEVEA